MKAQEAGPGEGGGGSVTEESLSLSLTLSVSLSVSLFLSYINSLLFPLSGEPGSFQVHEVVHTTVCVCVFVFVLLW